jgi:hypothetical protein
MTRFRKELSVIPWPAWAIAVFVYLALGVLMVAVPLQLDPEIQHWPLWLKAFLVAGPGLPMAICVLLVGYVNGDARRRGMRYVMWTLLAALIPNAIGIILYFVLREPLTTACPRCAVQLRPGYAFCPKCGAATALACPQCRSAVEPGWSHCPRCGAAIPTAA